MMTDWDEYDWNAGDVHARRAGVAICCASAVLVIALAAALIAWHCGVLL